MFKLYQIAFRVGKKGYRYSVNICAICDYTFVIGATLRSFRYRNRVKITVLICEQKPCPVPWLKRPLLIAILSLTSSIDINVPTGRALVLETKDSFVSLVTHLNGKKIVDSQYTEITNLNRLNRETIIMDVSPWVG